MGTPITRGEAWLSIVVAMLATAILGSVRADYDRAELQRLDRVEDRFRGQIGELQERTYDQEQKGIKQRGNELSVQTGLNIRHLYRRLDVVDDRLIGLEKSQCRCRCDCREKCPPAEKKSPPERRPDACPPRPAKPASRLGSCPTSGCPLRCP